MATLYEDNAGGLYLEGDGKNPQIFAGLEYVEAGRFRADALALDDGDTASWTVAEIDAVPDHAIAIAYTEGSQVTVVNKPGATGRDYLYGPKT